MTFLSHIFLSLLLVVQGIFSHPQLPTTTSSSTVSVATAANNSEANTSETSTPTTPRSKDLSPVTPVVSPNSTFCNGTYYSKCSNGAALICPNMGAAYCQSSTPAQAPIQQVPNTPAVVPSTNDSPSLTISPGQIVWSFSATAPIANAYVTWDTSVPTDSKIFFTQTGQLIRNSDPSLYCVTSIPVTYVAPTQVISSDSGNSTHHYVNVTGLQLNYQYTAVIEAIAGVQDSKKTILFNTSKYGLCPTN